MISNSPLAQIIDKPKLPVGRPSLYRPEYCQAVIEDMQEGYSLSAFAGLIGVCKATLNLWMGQFPEFLDAVSKGKAARLRKWESSGLRVAEKGGAPGTATMIVFGLKNMGGDEWSDKQHIESTISNPDGTPIALPTVTIHLISAPKKLEDSFADCDVDDR